MKTMRVKTAPAMVPVIGDDPVGTTPSVMTADETPSQAPSGTRLVVERKVSPAKNMGTSMIAGLAIPKPTARVWYYKECDHISNDEENKKIKKKKKN